MIFNSFLYDWLVVSTPLKNMNVNWDYEIPNIWENRKWQPNHQPNDNFTISQLPSNSLQPRDTDGSSGDGRFPVRGSYLKWI